MLAQVLEHPDRSVTQLYAALALSGYKEDRLKRKLLDRGLVSEVAAHLGQRVWLARFLVPTGAAFACLDVQRPRGRGGPFHLWLQRLVAEKARVSAYETTCEAAIKGGAVDVLLVGPRAASPLRSRRSLPPSSS